MALSASAKDYLSRFFPGPPSPLWETDPEFMELFANFALDEVVNQGDLLVLGTEECMYPALTVGSLAEQTGLCATVRCHATTRSPIGICPDSAYPIRNGVLLPSFYGGDRKTYLYDLAAYDAALVVTDAPAAVDGTACTRLAAALGQLGCPRLYLCRI